MSSRFEKIKRSFIQPSTPGEATVWRWSHVHLIVVLVSLCFLFTIGIGTLLFIFVAMDIPSIRNLKNYQPPVTSLILDEHEQVVDRIYHQDRTVISIETMPKQLPQAFVAAEDARFYTHVGVDAWSIARALVNNLRSGGRGQGGSTITQQVARSLLLTPEKTYSRKIKEAILAYRIDKVLSKDEILNIYLNQIYLGEGAYGVEAAAHVYFGKPARQLKLAEVAILAGLPQAPSRYSPLKHLPLAKRRQAYVLNRMVEEGFITKNVAGNAYQQPLFWAPPPVKEYPENQFFIQHVRSYIENKYGKQALTEDGLTVYTTLDPELQRAAALAINNGLDLWAARQGAGDKAARPEGALLAMEASTGQVRAMIGGSDFAVTQFNRAVQARRQPGSAFKPIVYAAALASGMTPATIINDSPVQLPGASAGMRWEPKNFDNKYLGPTTLRDGLVHSRNVITIRMLQQVGIPKVVALARDLGIASPLAANLSLALGSSGVSLQEIAGAYAALANGGLSVRPLYIKKIVDRDGRVLEQNRPERKVAMDERTAFQVTHLLQGVINEGTGMAARGLPVAAAGKTGTTDQGMDAWFVGYTPDLVAGVWIGFDQKRSLGGGETGGRAAAPVWLDFMLRSSRYFVHNSFRVPGGIVFGPVKQTAALAAEGTGGRTTWEPFRRDQLPWPEEPAAEEEGVEPAPADSPVAVP
ncbi:MAG: penicillin-binding protein 1A [Desulfobulbaceae bacterium]|nr:penicillin-binding protein 1A [Desulfobulbaceae bacterium]